MRPWKFGTDGGHSCGTCAVPTIGWAPGLEALAHTNRERLGLEEARTAFDACPALIRAVQAALTDARGLRFNALAEPGARRRTDRQRRDRGRHHSGKWRMQALRAGGGGRERTRGR